MHFSLDETQFSHHSDSSDTESYLGKGGGEENLLIRSDTESEEEIEQKKVFGMQLYLFKPHAASTSTNLNIVDAIEDAKTPTRIGNTDWCKYAIRVLMTAEHVDYAVEKSNK